MKIGLFLATLAMASAQDATLDQVVEGEAEEYSRPPMQEYSRAPVQENVAAEVGNEECRNTIHEFDPFMHKKVYTVCLHAIRGFDAAVQETQAMFQDFLTATAGRQFDPPIRYVELLRLHLFVLQ